MKYFIVAGPMMRLYLFDPVPGLLRQSVSETAPNTGKSPALSRKALLIIDNAFCNVETIGLTPNLLIIGTGSLPSATVWTYLIGFSLTLFFFG